MISIAIITYNHERYIRKALDSVLSQEIDEDIEIIIGDDGSTDHTVEIVSQYTAQYPFINLWCHENYGISKNVYGVFMRCQGRYIAVLEGDDFWIDKKKLIKQVNLIENNDCIATVSNMIIVDENNNQIGAKLHNKSKDYIITKKLVEKYQTKLFLPSSLLFKNFFLNSNDKYCIIRDSSKFGGSHSGMINLLGFLGNIYYSSECLAVWRKVTNGTSNFSSQKQKDIFFCYDQLRKYYYYSHEFRFNYCKYIKKNYYKCIDCLSSELLEEVGRREAVKILVYSFIKMTLELFRKKK